MGGNFGNLHPGVQACHSPDLRPMPPGSPAPPPLLNQGQYLATPKPTTLQSPTLLPNMSESGPPLSAATALLEAKQRKANTSSPALLAKQQWLLQQQATANEMKHLSLNEPDVAPNGIAQAITSPAKATKNWEHTLEKAIRSIISIRANAVRAFDTESTGAYNATGFIVDATRGIILSNRHVVSPGPITAKGTLSDYEEVTIYPIYRDPVHDFGFFKFDPSHVKFMSVDEIQLNPQGAHVGSEIRVVGNDAGEKLSILSGTLARMDRASPDYGQGNYNDFNTFYYQAASGTSGGSSGSPVLDIHGDAIALNAGGASKAASSYYLPLDRIDRALKLLQANEHVPRGTIQTEWEHLAFDEVRRLGLMEDTEAALRRQFPANTGMLVMKQVLPKGPADGQLVSGDILLTLQGEPVIGFAALEALMDDHVDQTVELDVQRGGDVLHVQVQVQDLHSITPSRYLDIGDAVLNDLSYQMARSFSVPVGGVYVAYSGYMFAYAGISRKSVVTEINHTKTPTLDAFLNAIRDIPDGKRVPVRYFHLSKVYQERIAIVYVDRRWFPCRLHVRDDTLGFWNPQDMPPPPGRAVYSSSTAVYPTLDPSLAPADTLFRSLVAVDFHVPFLVEGVKKSQIFGAGLIVDDERGYVLTDKYTIPITTGDVYLTFAASVVIPATIVFSHPTYNYVLLQYDPALIGETKVKAATFSSSLVKRGQDVMVLTLHDDNSPLVRKTSVSSVSELYANQAVPPRYRAVNVEKIEMDDAVGGKGGLVAYMNGQVCGMWVTYSLAGEKGDNRLQAGLPIHLVTPVLESLKKAETPNLLTVSAEIWTMRLSSARNLGLAEEWVRRVEAAASERHTLLQVLGTVGGSALAPISDQSTGAVAPLLKEGDVILDINGQTLTRLNDVASLLDKSASTGETSWSTKIMRDGQEIALSIPLTRIAFPTPPTAMVGWAGAILQEPYHAVLEQVKQIPNGPYISCTMYGSPADVYSLRSGVWVTEINGKRVENLHDFYRVVKEIEASELSARVKSQKRAHRSYHDIHPAGQSSDQLATEKSDEAKEPLFWDVQPYIRLKTVNRTQVTRVLSIRTDEHYWPTYEVNLSRRGVTYLRSSDEFNDL